MVSTFIMMGLDSSRRMLRAATTQKSKGNIYYTIKYLQYEIGFWEKISPDTKLF